MLLEIVLPLVFALTASAQGNGLTISTRQGAVVGTLVSPTVRQFLGVPYAIANRWEAPQLPPVRSKPFAASNFGDSCPQAFTPSVLEFLKLSGFDGTNVSQSENCLSANIWAPSVTRKQRTAVMIWVYGGSFQFGTSNSIVYNGHNLVRDNEDVLLVSFNYRLNLFGQPNVPQLSSTTKSQNFGLLDLDAAVQWVHDNIAAFGGDPDRIILFGESAGALAVDAYTFFRPNDTRVKGVIEESGNIGLPISGAVGSNGTTIDPTPWNQVASAVGCGNATIAAQLACMKAVPFRTLEDAVISTGALLDPIADDITIFADSPARSAAGNFLHVPLLSGTNAQEGDIFIIGDQDMTVGFTIPVLTELLSDIMTELVFTCPAGKTTGDRVNAGVNTWRYQYQAVFPDTSSRPDLRAYHASEIPIVFGTYNASTVAPATSIEVALSKYIQGAWVAFARDPVHGLINYGWPLYSPNTTSLAQLGNFFNQTGVLFTQGQLVDFSCASASTLAAMQAQLTEMLIQGG